MHHNIVSRVANLEQLSHPAGQVTAPPASAVRKGGHLACGVDGGGGCAPPDTSRRGPERSYGTGDDRCSLGAFDLVTPGDAFADAGAQLPAPRLFLLLDRLENGRDALAHASFLLL